MLTINHQTLIATKANRVVRAAQGRSVVEAGSRRAHGAQAALLGARSAYIGGCIATSNVQASKLFDIPVFGGMSHTWIQVFDSELEAFCTYAREYPDNCILLESFLRLHPSTAFWTLLLTMMATPFLLRDCCLQLYIYWSSVSY